MTRLSTEDTAENRELEQLLSEQERMVIHTDEVTVTGDARCEKRMEAGTTALTSGA